MLAPDDREFVAQHLPLLGKQYPKLLVPEGVARAFVHPPASPDDCLFSKMSANYSADLRSRVEPCVFGGSPDCSQCGCSISSALHWIRTVRVAGPLKVDHFVSGSIGIGSAVNRLRSGIIRPPRWDSAGLAEKQELNLVQIHSDSSRGVSKDSSPSRTQ
jgi:hypothetical protein